MQRVFDTLPSIEIYLAVLRVLLPVLHKEDEEQLIKSSLNARDALAYLSIFGGRRPAGGGATPACFQKQVIKIEECFERKKCSLNLCPRSSAKGSGLPFKLHVLTGKLISLSKRGFTTPSSYKFIK